ncbi:MAG: cytochrome c biogenesis protein CcsA [Desulfovibrionaceae bacterium]|nr:cytochrome c biogenesis protein CcsA [Desulfovibrionaceae bacterium]
MLSHQWSTLITLFLYGFSTILGLGGLLSRQNRPQTLGCWLALAGFVFQTLTLILGFHKTFQGGLTSGAYLQMLAWFVALAGLIIGFKLKQRAALILATPFCLMLFGLSIPYLEKIIHIPESIQSSFYLFHIASLFMSLALLAMSFIVSAIFLILEKRLKTKKLVKGFMQDLPALSILDKINGFGILSAFPLYTLGLISGLLKNQPTYGAIFTGDPKEVFSLVIWALLAVIFHNRLAKSWTGKKPALMMVGIFVLSLFSLLVINTVMDSHHAFIRN